MNAVLISINPHWCNLIIIGLKGVELRKTRPKIKTAAL
jgi:predicted transcriptional regulator